MLLSKRILRIRSSRGSSVSSGSLPSQESSLSAYSNGSLDVKEPTSRIVLNTSDLDLGNAYAPTYAACVKETNVPARSLFSDALKTELVPTDQALDKTSERVAYSLSDTLPAGSKASLKVSFKGELTGSMMGYYKSTYEEDGKSKYYALTQFEVSWPSLISSFILTFVAYCCPSRIPLLG